MYRHCIFCSAPLGQNESVERFPVGRSVAFDAARGRLWAVCAKCGRWNLAPIEERWEAVEEGEKLFRDTRRRVQSENVGLAKLRDGTRLIRIGAALPKEFAAWRWGELLGIRRRRQLRDYNARDLVGLAAGAVSFVALAPFALGGATMALVGMRLLPQWMPDLVESVFGAASRLRRDRKVVHRLHAGAAFGGTPRKLRRGHLDGAYLGEGEDAGELVLHVPASITEDRRIGALTHPLVLRGADARAVLGRALVDLNARGASPRVLELALGELDRESSPGAYLAALARRGATLGVPRGSGPRSAPPLYWAWRARELGTTPQEAARAVPVAGAAHAGGLMALALEMSLHEEQERRALQGELAVLQAAWREAEEIAAIADVLPDDPLKRLGG